MPTPALKSLAKQAGISLKDAEKKWEIAKKEASTMGQSDNYAYIMAIFKSLAGLDEEDISKTQADLANRFLESGYKDFLEFIEDVVNDTIKPLEEVISGSFIGDSSAPLGTTPTENPIGIKKVGNPDKHFGKQPKSKTSDHIGDYPAHPELMDKIDAVKQAKPLLKKKDIALDASPTDLGDNDPRGMDVKHSIINQIDDEEMDAEVIQPKTQKESKEVEEEIMSTDFAGQTPEKVTAVTVHPPKEDDEEDEVKKMNKESKKLEIYESVFETIDEEVIRFVELKNEALESLENIYRANYNTKELELAIYNWFENFDRFLDIKDTYNLDNLLDTPAIKLGYIMDTYKDVKKLFQKIGITLVQQQYTKYAVNKKSKRR